VDVRGAASAAHVYGKPMVATETFTGGGYEAPYTLKKIADYWFTQGVNRLVFHTSAEQPLDTKPGNTMVGTHINRNITWAEQAKPFMTYFARVSYMLQQGSPVADLAYLLPEGAPSTMPFWGAGCSSRAASGIRLRLPEHRHSAAPHQRGGGWAHACGGEQRDAGRHELPRAGAAADDADDAGGFGQAARTGGGGRDDRGGAAEEFAEPAGGWSDADAQVQDLATDVGAIWMA
jgi:hypothetical protein